MADQIARAHRSSVRLQAACAVAAPALAVLAGCGNSQRAMIDDRPHDDVWMAVVQASRQPRYGDWIVVQNEVKVDDATHRVTVWRDLRRDVVEPGSSPRREERQWRLVAQVADGTPTAVTLSSPDWTVPAHFWNEADHFFGQVRARLDEMGPVTPAPGDPAGGAAAQGARDPKAPGHVPPPPPSGGLAAP